MTDTIDPTDQQMRQIAFEMSQAETVAQALLIPAMTAAKAQARDEMTTPPANSMQTEQQSERFEKVRPLIRLALEAQHGPKDFEHENDIYDAWRTLVAAARTVLMTIERGPSLRA